MSREDEYEYEDEYEPPGQRELSGYDALNGMSVPHRPNSGPGRRPPSPHGALPARRTSTPRSGPEPRGAKRTSRPARLRDYSADDYSHVPRNQGWPEPDMHPMRPVEEWDDGDSGGSRDAPRSEPESWQESWDAPRRHSGHPGRDYGRTSSQWDESFPRAANAVAVRGQPRRAATAKAGRRFLATKRSRVLAAIVCVLLLLGAASSTLFGISSYRHLTGIAKSAVQHLTAAKLDLTALKQNPLDTISVERARQEFVAAHGDFVNLNQSLETYSAAQVVPLAGGKVGSALRLAAIGVEATQAGVVGCEALGLLATRLKQPFDPKGQGLTQTDLASLQRMVGQVATLFDTITQQVNALQPSDLTLDSRLGPLVAEFRGQLPRISQAVADVQTLVGLAGPLLGVSAPAQYMLEIMDSTELRPGGGFIGNYGFLTLQNGRLAKDNPIQLQDVDLLDINVKYGNQVIPIPQQYAWFSLFQRWGFRDSNLDADFPTSARNAEQLYKEEGGKESSLGVIAITPWVIQAALRIVGPVAIPELKTTVTADNLVQQIHYNQLTAGVAGGPDYILDPTTGTSLRKRFSGLLFKHFIDQVKKTSAQHFSALVHLLGNSLSTKDIQVYLNDPRAEAVLQHNHLASTIEAPAQGDSIFVVDANISGTKANYYIKQKLTDRVSIDASGTATHVTTLAYTFPEGPDVLANTYSVTPTKYKSYLRVYVPPGAKLQKVVGWGPLTTTTAFGRQVWGDQMHLSYGEKLTITLNWTLPGAAVKQGNVWQYDYTLQHQAGVTWQLDEQVHLPSCAQAIATSDPLKASGARSVAFAGPFSQDIRSSTSYSCA